MFRKNVIWNKLEGFNPSITYAQDWELWLRVPPQYKLANLPEPLIDLRLHPNSSSLVFRHIMDKEGENIKRLNFRRMFSGTNGSEKWLSQINDLMDKCNNHPKFQLELIDMLFKQFCVLYPDASKNQEVLKHLSKQYFNVLSHTSFRSLSEAIRILSLAWPISPKKFYLDKTLRWMAACLGVRGTRDWIYERRKFFNAK